MKLSVWAKSQGISYKTAWRMWKDGRLPVPAEQMATGTVIVHAEPNKVSGAALYARVSSADQKSDLDRQLARLTEFAVSQNLPVVDAVKEVGSGLNDHRKGMIKLLRNTAAQTIVVEHRDRLTRFGFEYVEAALAAQGRRIVVIEPEEMTDDVVRDLHEVIVSMCARLYGKRSAKNRAQKALAAMQAVDVGGDE
ncbi:IS607 family transposase [Pseudomonas aeruginosa]|uniref:IS607 family transposase n=1 Tax=Pseudomonas aeruginosa TaxID=287 RepID=UPI00070930FD|nr:IS607 family transposase [Pseudomonas aeruginosa]